ncbi:MAG TPA: hypothetical protein VGE94_13760, partial [Chloroflexota bacterium]
MAESPEKAEPTEEGRSIVTRRDFLVGAGAGAAVVGVVGAGVLATRGGPAPPAAVAPIAPTSVPPPAQAAAPTAAPQPTAIPQAAPSA